MSETNTARVCGEVFEFGDFAGYEFGVDADNGAATIALKFKAFSPEDGLTIAQRLEVIRMKGIPGASGTVQAPSG
jgi:hypothetical protein